MRVGRLIASFAALPAHEMRFVALSWLFAPASHLLLRSRGMRAAATLANRLPAVFHGGVGADRGEWLVKAAFRHAPAPAGCLPEAVVQLAAHRLAGDRVRLLVGVRRAGRFGESQEDFEAHAWIEDEAGPSRDERHAVIFTVEAP